MQPKLDPLIRDIYRRLREAMGIGLSELARKLGINAGRLSKWELDKAGLREEKVKLLGEVLNARADAHVKKYSDMSLEFFTSKLFKELREAHGLSQAEMANRAGILRFTISMFEIGHKQLKSHEQDRASDAIRRVIAEREEQIRRYQKIAAELKQQIAIGKKLAVSLSEYNRREKEESKPK